jgi:hypothetical protein
MPGLFQVSHACREASAWPRSLLLSWTRGRRPPARDGRPWRCCIREKQRRRADCSYPCVPSARGQPCRAAAVLLLVQPSSERTVEPVRQDCSSARKQESRPALLIVVHSGRLRPRRRPPVSRLTKRTSASCGRPAPPPPWPHARRRVRGPRPARRSPRRADLGWRSTAASWSLARADAQTGSLDAERDRAALGRLAATADVG